MNTQLHPTHPVLRCASLLAVVIAACLCAMAQEKVTLHASFANNAQPVKIDVQVGQSRVIDFDQDIDRVASSDPKIVETVPISFRQVLINGLQFGQVNLVAWSKPRIKGEASRMLVFDVYVQVNLSLIDNQIKILFPKENIQLSQANNSVVLSGTVTRPELSEQAQKIIEAAGLKVTNLLKSPVMDAAQVQLQIRVAEVNRSVLRELSMAYGFANQHVPTYISPNGPGSPKAAVNLRDPKSPMGTVENSLGANLLLGISNGVFGPQSFIRALHTRGALRDLAEPNLIAMHGQKASFMVGGEFPIPVVQSVSAGQTAITVVFKDFGVKLEFTPTIIDENHIRLELAPEVSSLDFGSGVRLDSFVIPGLRIRRAKTMLELRDGQSFALAGLIDNTEQVNLSKIPLLGDIPILGELFKSRSFQRNETELLFLATVKIVEPLNPDQLPRLPGVSELKPVNPSPPGGGAPSSSIEGQSGHSIPQKSGEQTDNKPKSEQPKTDANKVNNGATENLTSKLDGPSGPAGPNGPGGSDARAPKAENAQPPKTDAPKPDAKDQKPPQGNDKP
ncbi:MAG: type II and III secretion system protein family protein [Blastocatellia bacterium]